MHPCPDDLVRKETSLQGNTFKKGDRVYVWHMDRWKRASVISSPFFADCTGNPAYRVRFDNGDKFELAGHLLADGNTQPNPGFKEGEFLMHNSQTQCVCYGPKWARVDETCWVERNSENFSHLYVDDLRATCQTFEETGAIAATATKKITENDSSFYEDSSPRVDAEKIFKSPTEPWRGFLPGHNKIVASIVSKQKNEELVSFMQSNSTMLLFTLDRDNPVPCTRRSDLDAVFGAGQEGDEFEEVVCCWNRV